MESVYSKFYTGKPSDFGIGTWNSQPKIMTRSSSTPYLRSAARPLPDMLNYKYNYQQNLSPEEMKLRYLENKVNNLEMQGYLSPLSPQLFMPQNYYSPMGLPPVSRYYPNNGNNSFDSKSEEYQKQLKRERKKVDKLQKKLLKYKTLAEQTKANRDLDEDAKVAANLKNHEGNPEEIVDEYLNPQEGKNFIDELKDSLPMKLQEENLRTRNDIRQIQDNYQEIKELLMKKVEDMELNQQIQMENLRYALEKGGSTKLRASLDNAFEGKNYDLEELDDFDVPQRYLNIQKLVEEKLKEHEMKKEEERLRKQKLDLEIGKKVEQQIKVQNYLSQYKNGIYRLPPIEIKGQKKDIDDIVEKKITKILGDKFFLPVGYGGFGRNPKPQTEGFNGTQSYYYPNQSMIDKNDLYSNKPRSVMNDSQGIPPSKNLLSLRKKPKKKEENFDYPDDYQEDYIDVEGIMKEKPETTRKPKKKKKKKNASPIILNALKSQGEENEDGKKKKKKKKKKDDFNLENWALVKYEDVVKE